MKTSKRSLITAIAVLCVCALSLSAASFAWFTSTTNAKVSTLNMNVVEQSDLKIAIDTAKAGDVAYIEDTNVWTTSFTGAQIAGLQGATYTETGSIANATWSDTNTRFEKPLDEEAIDSVSGAYSGEMTAAQAPIDYVKFTVYFRSTEAGKVVNFTADNFALQADSVQKEGLLPALTLRVNGNEYTNANLATGGTVVTCNQQLGAYYIGSADFYIFVEGTHPNTINQNAGIKFVMNNLNFKYAE